MPSTSIATTRTRRVSNIESSRRQREQVEDLNEHEALYGIEND